MPADNHKCPDCRKSLPLTDEHWRRRSGARSEELILTRCRECENRRQRKRRADNKAAEKATKEAAEEPKAAPDRLRKASERALARLRRELETTAPDLVESCAVHLDLADELTARLKSGVDARPAPIYQRLIETASFVVRLIEARKAEGRAQSEANEAADLIVRAIYDPDFVWTPHATVEDEEGGG